MSGVIELKTSPESVIEPEIAGQSQTCVDSDPALAGDDFADPHLWRPDILGESVSGVPHRFQEFFEENFTRRRIRNFAHSCAHQ